MRGREGEGGWHVWGSWRGEELKGKKINKSWKLVAINHCDHKKTATSENSLKKHTLQRKYSHFSVKQSTNALVIAKEKSPRLNDGLVHEYSEQNEQVSLARFAHVAAVVLGGKARQPEDCLEKSAEGYDDDGPNQYEKVTKLESVFDAAHGLLADYVSDTGIVGQLGQKAVV